MIRKISIAFPILLLAIGGCRLFVKPEPATIIVERAQGSYSYTDTENSYSGRFVLTSHEDKLGMELYGPFHLYVASIRYNQDSTLLYLPLDATVFIMGPNATIPFEGWEIPVKPLSSILNGSIPSDPDSTSQNGDTTIIWHGGIAYCRLDDQNVVRINSDTWDLYSENSTDIEDISPARIIFSTRDSELIFNFAASEFKEKDLEQAFSLNTPEDVNVLDLREF